MTDTELPIRSGTPQDWDPVAELMLGAFHGTFDADFHEIERHVYEPDRSLIATDGDDVVGHAAAFTRDLTVPGAVVPAGHVTMVSVASTHRRRRLLTRMMHRQLREIRDAGREPIAVLWASEGRIYPRFGYGRAAERLSMEIDSREVALRQDWQRDVPPAGRIRAGEPAGLRKELETVYERLRPDRPGWSSRDDRWWNYALADTEPSRGGATALRAAVHYGADGPTGYAVWRARAGWDPSGPRAEVIVKELAAAEPGAYAALWQFLLGIDLVRQVQYRFAATDEPLLQLVAEVGRLAARLGDSLWVRVIDVGAALSARRYAVPVDVVIEVDDPLLPENSGRWHLVGSADTATCEPTTAPADLSCGVSELAAAYLGGASLAALAAAGRVRELHPGTLAPASQAFGWHRAPVSPEVF
jgi:predicted acetyltransferase